MLIGWLLVAPLRHHASKLLRLCRPQERNSLLHRNNQHNRRLISSRLARKPFARLWTGWLALNRQTLRRLIVLVMLGSTN